MTQLPFCNSFFFSKQHKLKFPINNGKKNNENYGLVDIYIWRSQYFLTFIDNYSQYTMVKSFKYKYQIFEILQIFKACEKLN